MVKYVYSFGNGESEGGASQMDLLGGKGANLAEMSRLGIPVPPGFTITTECCNHRGIPAVHLSRRASLYCE